MASLFPGYEYDIFISYRQKDNKYDGWVTEFVDNLKRELEATFKEDISVYFDINPHDGLLETHDVDASLKEKLKCLVFIPVISRTYCDPKSFAWEHEFKAFVENASGDQFGLKVKLPGGNIANRILPVRIHDLDTNDIQLCESLLGGVLRGVEFIYKEPGVNRPLTPDDDDRNNLNKTKYRNQINKIANAIKEIVSGLLAADDLSVKEKASDQLPWEEAKKGKSEAYKEKQANTKKRKLFSGIFTVILLALLATLYVYPKLIKQDTLESLKSTGKKISVAVMPFQNMTNDTAWNGYQNVIQMNLISALTNSGELNVRQEGTIASLIKVQEKTQNISFSQSVASAISKKLNADIFIYGNLQKAGPKVRLNAQLINTNTNNVLKSIEIEGPYNIDQLPGITDSLRREVTDFLLISKLIKENPWFGQFPVMSGSPEAYRYFIYGDKAKNTAVNMQDLARAEDWFKKSLAADSNFFYPMNGLIDVYEFMGRKEEALKWTLKIYQKKSQWPPDIQIDICWIYATTFEPVEVQIKYLIQSLQIDDQNPTTHWLLGNTYSAINQYGKAIAELEKAVYLLHNWGVDDPWYYSCLGDAYHKTGKYKKEKALYKKAAKYIKVADQSLIHREAVLSLSENDTVSARKQIEKYYSYCNENSVSEADKNSVLGWIYWEAGIKNEAVEYFRKALSLDPDNTNRMNLLACRLIERNEHPDEVFKLLDKAMESARTKWDYYMYLDSKCWGLIKFGRNKEALDIIEEAWKSTPLPYYFLKARLEEARKTVASQN